jgi:hypothetical protein
MIRFIHYSRDRIDKLMQPIDRFNWVISVHGPYSEEAKLQLYGHYKGWKGPKPQGLWFSVETGSEDGWKDWSLGNDFRVEHLQYQYEIKLSDDANLVWINTVDELDEFTEQNKVDDSDRINFYRSINIKPSVYELDWRPIKGKYQGIIIAPYLWERRLTSETAWYYGWDCASGCIWNIDCIKEFNLVNGPLCTLTGHIDGQ